MKFLLVCSHGNGLLEFRIPELESIADLYKFKLEFITDPLQPFVVIDVASEKEAKIIAERSVSVRHIWIYWTHGSTYDEIHKKLQETKPFEGLCDDETKWKFTVSAYGKTITLEEQRNIINTFNYFKWKGKIDLKKPDLDIGVFEEYPHELGGITASALSPEKQGARHDLQQIWIGVKLGETCRHMMDDFNLKKRKYIGTTSMEAEMSLYMANQAQAAPGRLIYDPFAGTGSMLVTCSAFGAYSMGSDIDGRQMRGTTGRRANKEKAAGTAAAADGEKTKQQKQKKKYTTGIWANAEQYGVESRIVDCATFDICQHPFRQGGIFDAIVTDPPYGVRAGAKRLGRKQADELLDAPRKVRLDSPNGEQSDQAVYAHEQPDYVPPTKPFEMSEVISYLTDYARYLLKPGGRLVYFLPTDNEEYSDIDIPIVDGLELISNSEQNFGKWSRRLITMKRVPTQAEHDENTAVPGHVPVNDSSAFSTVPSEAGHKHFRNRFFDPLHGGKEHEQKS